MKPKKIAKSLRRMATDVQTLTGDLQQEFEQVVKALGPAAVQAALVAHIQAAVAYAPGDAERFVRSFVEKHRTQTARLN